MINPYNPYTPQIWRGNEPRLVTLWEGAAQDGKPVLIIEKPENYLQPGKLGGLA